MAEEPKKAEEPRAAEVGVAATTVAEEAEETKVEEPGQPSSSSWEGGSWDTGGWSWDTGGWSWETGGWSWDTSGWSGNTGGWSWDTKEDPSHWKPPAGWDTSWPDEENWGSWKTSSKEARPSSKVKGGWMNKLVPLLSALKSQDRAAKTGETRLLMSLLRF